MAIKEPTIAAPGQLVRDAQTGGPLDMAGILTAAYQLGDMINDSADAADYAYWKSQVDSNGEVQQLIRRLDKAKETFQECERFGRFHPDFHAAKDKVNDILKLLDEHECVRRFKAAEKALDELLHEVSRSIAYAVSEDIKVPSNDPLPSGCGSGGSCSCGSGGCG